MKKVATAAVIRTVAVALLYIAIDKGGRGERRDVTLVVTVEGFEIF